jgi:16S rRNA G966 N2-methylase RsmD
LENINIKEIKPSSRIGNKFVDYFTFLERLETTGKSGKTFFEYYEERNKLIRKPYIKRLFDYFGKNTNVYKKWYGIFNLYQSSISIFKPVLAMEIYNKFKPHTVLDPTMGWGGRLVGACALDVPNYIGIDLNKSLKEPYEEMEDKLKELGTKTNIKLMFQDALKTDYSKLKYDMVFTSPPYYNIEIYKGTKKQTKEDWDNNFYFPLFEKTYKYLQKGGKYILNVPQEVYERVCIPLLGKADILFPLKKIERGASTSKTGNKININYKEYIYIWNKKETSGQGAFGNNSSTIKDIEEVSDFKQAQKKTNEYFGKPTKLYLSDKLDKKYYVLDDNNKKIYFGSSKYEDFTKHKDEERRKAYLKRATNIKGNWKNNKYSPNNLSINILW